jgi:hypothetical protein
LWEGFFAYIQTVIRISNWGISEEMIADLFRKIPGREAPDRSLCKGPCYQARRKNSAHENRRRRFQPKKGRKGSCYECKPIFSKKKKVKEKKKKTSPSRTTEQAAAGAGAGAGGGSISIRWLHFSLVPIFIHFFVRATVSKNIQMILPLG